MKSYREYLSTTQDLVAMIHVQALPGTPDCRLSPDAIIDKSIAEAQLYKDIGYKTVMIENMHDVPYVKSIGPEITGMMSVIGHEIKKLNLFCGVQILAGGNKEALAVALSAGLDFVRVEGYVFLHVGDEGLHESCAGEIMRYRRSIGAENVLVFTDVKKKHSSHAITADIDLKETAKAAVFFKSDGIIVTGGSTGSPPSEKDLEIIQDIPVRKIIGSGITSRNLSKFIQWADIFIVGSELKKEGHWANDPDEKRAEALLDIFSSLKNEHKSM